MLQSFELRSKPQSGEIVQLDETGALLEAEGIAASSIKTPLLPDVKLARVHFYSQPREIMENYCGKKEKK